MKVVNLNKVRKARDKSKRRAQADENAVKFGRTRAERHADLDAREKARRDLDGHKRET